MKDGGITTGALFPIIAGKRHDAERFAMTTTHGTTSPIGGGYFMTAGHTIQNAATSEAFGVGWDDKENGRWSVELIETYEIFSGFDVAIFSANVPIAKPLIWASAKEGPLLDSVETLGHPNTARVAAGHLDLMAFRGYVVSIYHADNHMPLLSAKPPIYLLSFRCPVGMSGAPVWGPKFRVTGIVVGNVATDLPVFKFEEKLEEKGESTSLMQQEVAYFSVAVQSRAIVGLRSDALGMTIGEWLEKHGLIRD